MSNKKIIIVGGGAGGLELVVKLCSKFKHDITTEITLVDKQLKHIWKPLYHEVAAGTLYNYYDEIDYISYSFQKKFKFIPGTIKQINHKNKWIAVEPLFNDKQSDNLKLEYDVLVLAIGSETNDFNIPGVKDYCLFLDSLPQAELCNEVLLKQIISSTQPNKKSVHIQVVGGGATGVELAAELNYVLSEVQKYHKNTKIFPYEFTISVIEATDRILGMLPVRVSQAVSDYLQSNKINILTNTKITAVKQNGLLSADGTFIESAMIVWAAGVSGNVNTISHDLEMNKINQLIVKPTLQTTKNDSIFAFGDCASCSQIDSKGNIFYVPPRAQAAHQQAGFLVQSISNYLNNKNLPVYQYKDYGSLISLSQGNVIGNLMNRITKNLYIEGFLARIMYWLLYKKHLLILKGFKYVFLSSIANFFMKRQRPKIKLH